ncbi:tRNA (guanosine(37)-N1)-methyltransferase TrmD [Calorimonas adulescens]|jgi:tRNA (guanine-N1)-methyltransferase|uniref:tRNA (guanine-N(1)-)-methyltransferase n=1 Tax=Calorimonas adulescens TaxID=2606906 RepID=A0A5D8QIP2_9THEO|nr:tRNA (guanosine(37)-N1)-methyltransferase TrmD [Calorimonas adulescens]TZE83373.1 tRNA (guanosine(37)-N1)-methyltransferase TrmD [Calorimonas adulescens]
MKFDILTLFPEMFSSVFSYGIIKRAIDNNLIDINLHNIRDFSEDKFGRVDDYPYGGGPGMVLRPEPLYRAIKSLNLDNEVPIIYLSPSGIPFNQQKAKELATKKHIVIVSGHYEGIDERIITTCITEEISIGDYILNGGEIAAMVVIDAVARLLPGVLGNLASTEEESFNNYLLEYPQYTRPAVFNGISVPEVLLSGNHALIKEWRRKKSLEKTFYNRPDLLEKAVLDDSDKAFIESLRRLERRDKDEHHK